MFDIRRTLKLGIKRNLLQLTMLFDEPFYLAKYPEVKETGMSPLRHYLKNGFREGKDPNPLLWSNWYLATHRPRMDYRDPLTDFALSGWKKGRNPSPLFDVDFYLAAYPDVRLSGFNPLFHYLNYGASEGRWPNKHFDTGFYVRTYPAAASTGLNPLRHFLDFGADEGNNPSANFDVAFYRSLNPETNTGINPLIHYVEAGAKGATTAAKRRKSDPYGADDVFLLFDEDFYLARYPETENFDGSALTHYLTRGFREGKNPNPLIEARWYFANHGSRMDHADPLTDFAKIGWKRGRNPHPLFDVEFYLTSYPDVRSSGMNPLLHYLRYGVREGRRPNRYFDTDYYFATYPDVVESGDNPLYHFYTLGADEGRNPSSSFDVKFYRETNPGLPAGVNPLAHFISHGEAEGRATAPVTPRSRGAISYVPPSRLLPWFSPLNLHVEPTLSGRPYLNVLIPGLSMNKMSGGPNTALALAGRLAGLGVPVRFWSTEVSPGDDSAPFWSHVCRLADLSEKPPDAMLIDASNRFSRKLIGENDIFMATAWWTAQMAKYAIKLTNHKTFAYLIQDYEPLLHAASTAYALAEETYSLDHIGIINTELLREFLSKGRIGCYSDQAFAREAIVFNPAVDQTLFYPSPSRRPGKRRLLFYARPETGLRNLFELGVAALQKCLSDGILLPDSWEFIGMGEDFAPIDLGFGCTLQPAPWLNLDGYAEQMRESDLLLSLMLSPHPSYPPLEMAFCNRKVVTNVYANKSAARLAAFSTNIIGAESTVEGLCSGISEALDAAPSMVPPRASEIPSTWGQAFSDTVPHLHARLLELFGAPADVGSDSSAKTPWSRAVGFRSWPNNSYEIVKFRRQAERKDSYASTEPGLLSFLTTVWNTDPAYLKELAESVFSQDSGPNFEWLILDNGSAREDTRDALCRIAAHPSVKLLRVEENLGIVGGMRRLLGVAQNRYIVPLDSDDILTPDCVRIVTSWLRQYSYPGVVYTDEDKVFNGEYRDPFDKPDWDPVLFFHSCYIAHLGCFDRALAQELGVYQDDSVSGCHDYDTFTRFYLAGHTPSHIPEIVYTWRMHQSSTAVNISAKDYIASSQKNLLRKFLNARGPDFGIEKSRLFDGTPDWHFVRPRSEPRSLINLVFGEGNEKDCDSYSSLLLWRSVELPNDATITDLRKALSNIDDGTLCHLRWRGCEISDAEWPWEAMGLIDLFPDIVMIGGIVHQRQRIVSAPGHFGFGKGCESPDIGRELADPGYFAQMFKEHSVACVPIEHCIIDASFLRSALEYFGNASLEISELSPWLGALARNWGKRAVYSPFLRAEAVASKPPELDDAVWLAFRECFPSLLSDATLLSPMLSRRGEMPYRPVSPSERARDQGDIFRPEIKYSSRARAERLLRQMRGVEIRRAGAATVSLMTSVYIRTDAGFLAELVESVRAQSVEIHEWTILINGPISEGVTTVLNRAASYLPIRQLRVEKNVGIQAAMARCLSEATAEFVCPLDADDLLEPDAVECVQRAIDETGADFVFTDEDHIVDGVLQAPYRRGEFDPVLNAIDSYIWHFVAYRRARAIELKLYSDPRAEFCHDWDTVSRFFESGAKMHHIPSVLYHWRMHSASTSASGELNEGTRRSVEAMLSKTISRCELPDLYEISSFPLDRGIPQLFIQRKPIRPLPMVSIYVDATIRVAKQVKYAAFVNIMAAQMAIPAAGGSPASMGYSILESLKSLSPEIGHALILDTCVELPEPNALYEAMRLFEMHPRVGAVGGRVVDLNGRVIDVGSSAFRDVTMAGVDWRGSRQSDPGAFALALKPQSALNLPKLMFFVRRDVLIGVLERHRGDSVAAISASIGEMIGSLGYDCAYSPIIQALLR